MAFALMAAAQEVDETFQFVDAQGNVVADGTTIVVNQLSEEGQMVIPLWVKNTSEERAAVGMYETIDGIPNGTWQTCAFGNCMMLTKNGYSPKSIVPDDYYADIQTEWIPQQGQYATWEATLQIHVFNIDKQKRFGVETEIVGTEVIGYGPKVTVRFEYKNASTIRGDVNQDGTVDVADISAIITVMANSVGSGFPAATTADVNGDNVVDVADISTVITIMAESSPQ